MNRNGKKGYAYCYHFTEEYNLVLYSFETLTLITVLTVLHQPKMQYEDTWNFKVKLNYKDNLLLQVNMY
jgi:hypothetical protein